MKTLSVILLLASLLVTALPGSTHAQTCDTFSGLPVPRFVTLRFDEAAGRAGPGRDHAIVWMYQRAGLPVQIVEETVDWRRVSDPDGDLVWMHRRLLSGRRAVLATEATRLHARADLEAPLIAEIEARAVLWLERCREGWCRLEADGRRGWAPAEAFWGVYPIEAQQVGTLEARQDPCYRDNSELAGEAQPDPDSSATR